MIVCWAYSNKGQRLLAKGNCNQFSSYSLLENNRRVVADTKALESEDSASSGKPHVV